MPNLVPMVIKRSADGERSFDIFSRLLDSRIIMLTGEVNDQSAELIVAQLLYLDSINSEDISLYINSPGGSVSAGFAIYDTMKTIKSKVNTYCMGMAASMGAFLLAAGDTRYCMPYAEVMIHQPLGGSQGQATDVQLAALHLLQTKERLNKILAERTGKDIDQIAADTDRDNWMTAEEALKYGLVDEVITPSTK